MEGLEHTSTLRKDLYRRSPTEGKAIPILVQPVDIPDRHPEGEEIAFLSEGTTPGAGERPIREDMRSSEGVANGGYTVK